MTLSANLLAFPCTIFRSAVSFVLLYFSLCSTALFTSVTFAMQLDNN